MVRVVADENFNNDIVRGVLRRNPSIDIVRAQDFPTAGADDPTLLAWAAEQNRVLFTHDVATITKYAIERLERGERMPGVFQVGRSVPILKAIEDLLLVAECSSEGEWEGKIVYLPL